MRHLISWKSAPVWCVVMAVALASASFAQTGLAPAADGGESGAVTSPVSLRTLYANVYLQTSAEYRACCYGIYRAAASRLEEILEEAEPGQMPFAVVMDLDETVLDVSSFQTFLYENGIEYTPELWSEFEKSGVEDLELVPGAKDFIEKAEEMGVTVVFLSNRNEVNQEFTVEGLERLGIGVEGIAAGRIYLKPDGGSSDKSPRRNDISSRYDVLMYLGDNLRDFSEVFAMPKLSGDAPVGERLSAIEARASAVEDAVCHWGVDWFVLPNPVYGEWEKLIGAKPEEILRPSSMKFTDGSE